MTFKNTETKCTLTFEDIILENRKRMKLMGITASNGSMCRLLMQMVSSVGELSNLAEQSDGAVSLSQFEHQEMQTLIGRISVCLFSIADVCDINIGKTVMDVIDDQIKRTNASTSCIRAAPKRSAPLPMAVSTAGTGTMSKGGVEKFFLSPSSNRGFFLQLDTLVTQSREDFEKADLRWVAPLPNGTIDELIDNGSEIRVRYEDIPKYMEMVQRYRSARTDEVTPFKYPSKQMSDRPDKRCKTAPLAIDPSSSKCDDHESFFSPPTADYVPLKTNATYDTNPDHFSDTTTQHRISANQAPDVAVVSENEFRAKVDAIRNGVIAGPLIAQQNLTFSVPRDGKLMELIPNGIYVKVTESNVSEFLRLLADKSAALSGRVRRLESIRRLEVAGVSLQDLSRDKDKFSPTHFSKDIFAPYDARTCFLVDADASEEILPLYLREQEELQRKADTYYLRVIRQGDIKTWRTIFDHVQSDPSALKRYGVTFCVPSALSSRDAEGDRELNVHELITRGSNTPVEESQLWLFTKMVKQLLQPVV